MESKRILLATDAFYPQVNGVSKSLQEVREALQEMEHAVEVVAPVRTVPNPFYPPVPLPVPSPTRVASLFEEFEPEHIHIATEGPIGILTRSYCVDNKLAFTTSFHTLWPEYIKQFMMIPTSITWNSLKWFHSAASCTMTRSRSMMDQLIERGFENVAEWNGSVDTSLFYPREKKLHDIKRPLYIYVGRVSVEKNLEAFLDLELGEGTKMIVGDGPYLQTLQTKYPDVIFLGEKKGEELAQAFSEGDVFVFPSLTDTFGRVVVEALACGVPVAAFPVTGPKDIISSPKYGALNEDLATAVKEALKTGNREASAEYAKKFSTENVSQQFLNNLVPAQGVGGSTEAPTASLTN